MRSNINTSYSKSQSKHSQPNSNQLTSQKKRQNLNLGQRGVYSRNLNPKAKKIMVGSQYDQEGFQDTFEPWKYSSSNVVGLFVGGLNGRTTEEQLASYFGQFGSILKTTIIKSRKKKWSSGFGFVYIETELDSSNLLAQDHHLDGHYLDCQELVERASIQKKQQEEQDLKLFVGGLPKNLPDETLREYFASIVPISKAYVVRDNKSGKTRGFGFLVLLDEEGVEKVIATAPHSIMGQLIHIKRSRSRSEIQREAHNTEAVETTPSNLINGQPSTLNDGQLGSKPLVNHIQIKKGKNIAQFGQQQMSKNNNNNFHKKRQKLEQNLPLRSPKYYIKASNLISRKSWKNKAKIVKIAITNNKLYPKGFFKRTIIKKSRKTVLDSSSSPLRTEIYDPSKFVSPFSSQVKEKLSQAQNGRGVRMTFGHEKLEREDLDYNMSGALKELISILRK